MYDAIAIKTAITDADAPIATDMPAKSLNTGKKLYDKRETTKKKDIQREIDRGNY